MPVGKCATDNYQHLHCTLRYTLINNISGKFRTFTERFSKFSERFSKLSGSLSLLSTSQSLLRASLKLLSVL